MALTHEQETTLIRLLQMCEPGEMPAELFYALCRLLPMVAIEVVTLRNTGGQTEVLLTQRPSNDPHFPNEWHFPGTILRVADFEGITTEAPKGELDQFGLAFARLAQNELGTMPDQLEFVGVVMQNSLRGPQLHLVFINSDTTLSTLCGTYFTPEALPEPFHDPHRAVLKQALSAVSA